MKKLKHIINGTAWTIISVYVMVIIMVRLPFVQKWLGRQVEDVIEKKLGTDVNVGQVYLGFLNRVIIDNFELYDKQNKKMLKASRLAARIDYGELISNRRIYISSAQVFGMDATLYKKDEHAKANYQFILDSLATKDKNKKSNLELSINSLIIRHGAIRYDRYDMAPTPSRFNVNHLDIKDISGHIIMPYYTHDSLAISVKKLSMKESSGIDLRRLKFDFTFAKNNTADKRNLKVANTPSVICKLNDFEINLPNTDIRISNIEAKSYDKSKKLNINSIQYNGQIEESKLTLSDIACFVPSLKSVRSPFFIQTSFSGTGKSVDVRQLNVHSRDYGITLAANGKINKQGTGLEWYINVRNFKCTAESIDEILENAINKDIRLPETVTHLGDIQYAGNVSGAGRTLHADGTFISEIGNADVKMSKDGRRINTYINTRGLNIGKLLDNDKFGILAATTDIECETGKYGISDIKIDGVFPRFDYNGYSYSGITAKGIYNKPAVSGTLTVNDPNAKINIEGNADLTSSDKTADIKATLRDIDLAALKITKKWNGTKFSADINANTQISEAETNMFKGHVKVNNFAMVSANSEYHIDSLTVTAGQNHLSMKSDFGRAELTGRYKIKTIAKSVINMLHSKMPTLFNSSGKTENKFRFEAEIDKTDWLAAMLDIPLTLNSPMTLKACVDDSSGVMNIIAKSDKVTYDNGLYEKVFLSAGTSDDTLSVKGNVRKVMSNGHRVDLNVLVNAFNDMMATSVHWNNNRKKQMAGTINTETRFIRQDNGKTGIDINVKPSNIIVNDTAWNVLPANITYCGGDLAIDHFAIEHNRQYIRIDGKATKHASDSISIDLKDVDVSYVLGLINFHAVEFSGYMTGKAYVKSVFFEPDAYANLDIKQFCLQGGRLGRLSADINWNKTDKRIDINAHADDKNGAKTIVSGYVSPVHKNIDLSISAKKTNIEFLHSFCDTFMDDIKADATGEIRLHGPLKAMDLTGTLVANGSILITPINVTYNLTNDTIRFIPDQIVFNADTIRDRNGNIGIVNGVLHHKHLKDMTYDINIRTNNMLCYDTKGYGEDAFYGTAYGTGLCSIQGSKGIVNIDIDVTPGRDSFIEYNATSPEVIADQQFITWRNKENRDSIHSDSIPVMLTDNDIRQQNEEDIPSDIRINFLINMNPDATLRVLMDKRTNDHISLNGSGTIRAAYFNKGSFDMFGTFTITHGLYTLTIQNIIKKIFRFNQGGTIIFGGSPYNALLDLQAIYTVNGVPLSDLQLGNSFSSNNVRVDCIMNISGTPKSPHVDFNIDMPTVSEDAEQMVRTVINSEEEMNQQVVYLLGVGRFYMQSNNNSSEQGRQNQTSLAMQSLLSGTISQQINTLLGTLVKNNNWTFGANISTGDEGFNNAEYEGLLSGRLLNNRLIINGQFGYRDNKNATTSFIGDFDINYLLKPNGDISLKVYNQTNDRYFTKSSLNTQGIGLILKKDFNSLMELFGYKRKKNNRK